MSIHDGLLIFSIFFVLIMATIRKDDRNGNKKK